MSNPNDLSAFLNLAWQHLARCVADAKSPARYPTFATVSPDGKPEARTVALRRACQSAGTIEIHTDTVTPKVASLRANPIAALHVWLPQADLQIRLTTQVTIMTSPETDAAWENVPPGSRISYGTVPDPGHPVASVYDYDKPPNRERFAVLRCRVDEIDLVELGRRHRRARFSRDTGWEGQWLAP